MGRVFLVHGWAGKNDQDWFPWAESELTELGYEVYVPAMPDSDLPKVEPWLSELKKVIEIPRPDDIFVGHSMGCLAILKYLEAQSESTKVKKLILVAGWEVLTEAAQPFPEDKQIVREWTQNAIDYDKVRKMSNSIVAIFSDNDPWVPFEENRIIYDSKLGAKIILMKNMGHFMKEEGGVTKFPFLVGQIMKPG